MTERIRQLLEHLNAREYRLLRREVNMDVSVQVSENKLSRQQASTLRFCTMIDTESSAPPLFNNDPFAFYRSVSSYPELNYTWPDGQSSQKWENGNVTVNYASAIGRGFDDILNEVNTRLITAQSKHREFLAGLKLALTAALKLADETRLAAEKAGNNELSQALERVPHQAAGSFYEALLFQKFLIFTLRCNRNTHLTLGRMDQYMKPYYDIDRARGIGDDELLETVEAFFISINADTDLYQGMQTGDNGQSLVLGGYDADGNDEFNALSSLIMEASLELKLIDPKINLRVSARTPLERYEYGTRLTKQGLGFPQYENDDIVIPGLLALGYAPDDAYNYTVAACWELIVPNCAMDVVNIGTFNFPKVVNDTIHRRLEQSTEFDCLMANVKTAIEAECGRICGEIESRYCCQPSPYLSLFIDGCLEKEQDACLPGTAKYYNYGIHGTGIAPAADALAAVKDILFEKKSVAPLELLTALDADFAGYEPLRHKLLNSPKMGNNDDFVDSIACQLMAFFSECINGRENTIGGIYRAGTGSAMEYYLSARNVPATADGRHAGDFYGSSYSPSVTVHLKGPISVIQSFTKFDLKRIINGGPLTLEIHDTTFRNDDGIRKVAQLVQAFIRLGGHELQLNSISRERLMDAQKHPAKYPNLIVRVWGWSGYFNELDLPYQEHIIRRCEFSV